MSLKIELINNLGKIKAINTIRAKARALCNKYPNICMNCGYNKHVEVCHIHPISLFPMDAAIDEINDLSNLVLLCPNCHWELDNLDLQIHTNIKLKYYLRH